MPYTVNDCLTETYRDIQVLAVGETLSAAQTENGLQKLARLFDNWNAERAGVYANRLTEYTLVPDLNPHTIGPVGGTFTTDQRPVTIDWANIVISDVRYPLSPISSQAWAAQTLPLLSTDIPQYIRYEPDWPLGKIYLYPVPSAAHGLELMTRVVLTELVASDTLSLPPGYRDAIIKTLGEEIAANYPPAQADPVGAMKARARIFANNDEIPTLSTRDSGMPGGQSYRWFDWQSGLWRNT